MLSKQVDETMGDRSQSFGVQIQVRGSTKRERFVYLDGLRGVAALIVVLSHYVHAFHFAILSGHPEQSHFAASLWMSRTPLVFFVNPELGVTIFFVLSGFVLAASSVNKPAPLLALCVRRWIRLAVPILGTSVFIWCIVQSGQLYNGPLAALNGSDWLAFNLDWTGRVPNDFGVLVWQSLIEIFTDGGHYWNYALWTMPIEFSGSLALFVVYTMLAWLGARTDLQHHRQSLLRLTVALGFLALTWRSNYAGFPAGAALFEIGRLASGRTWTGIACQVAGPPLALVGFVLGGAPWNMAGTFYWPTFLLIMPRFDQPLTLVHHLGALFSVAAVLTWPMLGKLLATRPFAYLGHISFMVYLLHISLICSLVSWLILWLIPMTGYNAATAIALPVLFAVLFALATFATKFIDQPAVRLSHWASRGVSRGFIALTKTPTGPV